jgi:hypothetical protein
MGHAWLVVPEFDSLDKPGEPGQNPLPRCCGATTLAGLASGISSTWSAMPFADRCLISALPVACSGSVTKLRCDLDDLAASERWNGQRFLPRRTRLCRPVAAVPLQLLLLLPLPLQGEPAVKHPRPGGGGGTARLKEGVAAVLHVYPRRVSASSQDLGPAVPIMLASQGSDTPGRFGSVPFDVALPVLHPDSESYQSNETPLLQRRSTGALNGKWAGESYLDAGCPGA